MCTRSRRRPRAVGFGSEETKLGSADQVIVVQDLFITKTAKVAANIFLPAASVFEKDGTFMNAERQIQRVRKAVAPPGEARTDWQITCALADRMGHGAHFRYGSSEDIWNEIR